MAAPSSRSHGCRGAAGARPGRRNRRPPGSVHGRRQLLLRPEPGLADPGPPVRPDRGRQARRGRRGAGRERDRDRGELGRVASMAAATTWNSGDGLRTAPADGAPAAPNSRRCKRPPVTGYGQQWSRSGWDSAFESFCGGSTHQTRKEPSGPIRVVLSGRSTNKNRLKTGPQWFGSRLFA